MNNIEQILKEYGLNDKAIEVYITLLQVGDAKVSELVSKTGVKRTTVYSILDILIDKKLVNILDKEGNRVYYAENPEILPSMLEQQVKKVENEVEKFKQLLPELTSMYNAHSSKPKIRFYEGIKGIKRIFEETLNLEENEEILAYSSAKSIHKYLQEYVLFYLNRRIEKGIRQRCIAEISEEAKDHQKNDKKELRETILVDNDKFPFTNEINIFKNKVMIVSYRDLMGVIIESVDVAKTQRSIFELSWIGAKQVGIIG